MQNNLLKDVQYNVLNGLYFQRNKIFNNQHPQQVLPQLHQGNPVGIAGHQTTHIPAQPHAA